MTPTRTPPSPTSSSAAALRLAEPDRLLGEDFPAEVPILVTAEASPRRPQETQLDRLKARS